MKALEAFESRYCVRKYPPSPPKNWRRNWEHVISFFAFPEGVRRVIHTTNAIEVWNTVYLSRAVDYVRTQGIDIPAELLSQGHRQLKEKYCVIFVKKKFWL